MNHNSAYPEKYCRRDGSAFEGDHHRTAIARGSRCDNEVRLAAEEMQKMVRFTHINAVVDALRVVRRGGFIRLDCEGVRYSEFVNGQEGIANVTARGPHQYSVRSWLHSVFV